MGSLCLYKISKSFPTLKERRGCSLAKQVGSARMVTVSMANLVDFF